MEFCEAQCRDERGKKITTWKPFIDLNSDLSWRNQLPRTNFILDQICIHSARLSGQKYTALSWSNAPKPCTYTLGWNLHVNQSFLFSQSQWASLKAVHLHSTCHPFSPCALPLLWYCLAFTTEISSDSILPHDLWHRSIWLDHKLPTWNRPAAIWGKRSGSVHLKWFEDQCFPMLIWVSIMNTAWYKFFLISSADEIITMKSVVIEIRSNTMPCIQLLRNVLNTNLCFTERFIHAYAAWNSTIMTENIKCWVILHNKLEWWAYLTRWRTKQADMEAWITLKKRCSSLSISSFVNLAPNEIFSAEESEFWRTFCASQETARKRRNGKTHYILLDPK